MVITLKLVHFKVHFFTFKNQLSDFCYSVKTAISTLWLCLRVEKCFSSFSTYDLLLYFFYKEIGFATVSDMLGLACLNYGFFAVVTDSYFTESYSFIVQAPGNLLGTLNSH